MTLIQLLLLGAIQGITEWLPISSSAHLLLAADYFGLDGRDEILVNAMAHVGTLFAILAYFWRDVLRAIGGGLELLSAPFKSTKLSASARLALHIIVATPFALLAGVAITQMPDRWNDALRTPYTVAASTILFGLALWWADVKGGKAKQEDDMNLRDAVLIGATQAIAALIPGTSRSGITMTAARALGFARTEAARFSMLIGAPILVATGAYAFLKLSDPTNVTGALDMTDGLIIAGFSAFTGFISIWALMALLKRISFLPFVIYRLVLGIALLAISPFGARLIGL
jgi:undecaprenyl-diphosphatase